VPAVDELEEDLTHKLVDLEEGTRARNRDFYEQTDKFKERTQRWEAKLTTETVERNEAHQSVLDSFQVLLHTEMAKIETKIHDMYAGYHDSLIPVQEAHQDRVEEFVEHFVNVTAPEVIEREQKAMEKKIKSAREGFDIENAKVRKREEKIVYRAEEHEHRTAQSFTDNHSGRVAKIALLREDLEAGQRTDDREEETRLRLIMTELRQMQERIDDLTKVREVQDCTILDSMLRSQEKLQDSIIENFGANSEQIFEDAANG